MSSIEFSSPSFRAASGDLSIAISPLGLVELADEEFEVHGPRLNRYASNWAFYLGHHYGQRAPVGASQLTFNYVKAFADYINNFTFGKGVHWKCPRATEAIASPLLQEIWEVHNDRKSVLWEMGQQGGVSGDCFVKIAWDQEYADPAGAYHAGRVRILPLNAAYMFPEWHPHDRERMLRCKLKYRFWSTSAEGTRQVYTFTEILTDSEIMEFVNDELISQRPNPLGFIPIVHIPNISVSSSPWGLSDIQDIIPLNQEYNTKATEISEIINYHGSPITIMKGAKASQMERGPNRMWAGLPKDADVYNLEMGGGLAEAMGFLEILKRAMHEMTGVPETALGQMQPISNTSGVALSIQFQPLMNRHHMKAITYGKGIEKINEMALRTLAFYQPQRFQWDPAQDVEIKPYQQEILDTADPLTYQTETHFPSPLPVDTLIKLNEIQAKMTLGLESKRGALRELGTEHVDEKMHEIFQELLEDMTDQGALDMLQAQIMAQIQMATGMIPGEGPATEVTTSGPKAEDGSQQKTTEPVLPVISPPAAELMNELTTKAYGTKMAGRQTQGDEVD